MKKKLKLGLIGVLLLFFSCNKKEEINTLKIGEVTEIKIGETVENSHLGLLLRVESVNDSRCPIGVVCAWQGIVYVNFHLTTKTSEYSFTLDGMYGMYPYPPFVGQDTIIEGIKYQLTDVLPYPDISDMEAKKTVKILVGN